MVVPILERAFNLDTCIIGSSLSKNGELHMECGNNATFSSGREDRPKGETERSSEA